MTSILVQQAIMLVLSFSIIIVVRSRGRRGELSFVLAVMWLGIAMLGVAATVLIPRIDTIGQSRR